MIRQLLEEAINNGYHILYNGELIKVDVDIKEYIDMHREDNYNFFVLSELQKLSDDELNKLLLL